MMRRGTGLLALCLVCAGCVNPAEEYVAADLATYRAIAPEYSAYIGRDESLGSTARQRRIDLLASWLLRIQRARVVR